MIRDEVSISVEAYTTVLAKENLGDPHSTVVGGELWYPPEEESRRTIRVLGELRSQGLSDGNRAGDDLVEALTVMQRAAVEYYTVAQIEGKSVTVRAAALGRDAVLVTVQDGTMTIAPIPVEQLGFRLAAALPTVPAAQMHSMSCAIADLEAVHHDKSVPQSNSVRDAKRMKRFLDLERINQGQLFAAVRDGLGGRKKNTAPVPCWIDTESGRALASPDDRGWLNLAGADLVAIANKLADLEKSLR